MKVDNVIIQNCDENILVKQSYSPSALFGKDTKAQRKWVLERCLINFSSLYPTAFQTD